MKQVLILFDKNSKGGLSPKLKKGFEEVYKFFYQKGISLCRAPISSYDPSQNLFRKAEFFVNHWQESKNIIPDAVYDKTPFYLDDQLMKKREVIAGSNVFINDLELSENLSNKWLTYVNFKKYCPQTYLISSPLEANLIKKIKSDNVMIKPLSGSGGRGIKIFKKNKLKLPQTPFIAQEFINNQSGINGLTPGPHDLRIFIVNEKPFYSYLRLPKIGSFLANIGQGGRAEVVNLKDVPKSVYEIIHFSEKKLKKFPVKFYSIDLTFDNNQRPWILEMNSRPGIIPEIEEGEKNKKIFFNGVFNFFEQALKK